MTGFILEKYHDHLIENGLYIAFKATKYKIPINIAQFSAIMELYCQFIDTFFTLSGKLGIALQEMWKVLELHMD